MNQSSEWYQNIARGIEALKTRLGQPESNEYHLDKLLKLSRHVDALAATCDLCQNLKPEIEKLVQQLNTPSQITRAQKRSYLGNMERIVSHLQKGHKLISEGQNLAIWLGIGTALGMAFGALFKNMAIGIALGVGVGVAIGASLDARAKKEGRVM